MPIDRRCFLKFCAQAALCSAFPVSTMAAIDRLPVTKRVLSLYNTHTREKLDVCYFARGQYLSKSLTKIDHILRDHRTEETMPIHKGLLNLLYSISTTLDRPVRFHIVSGYRSPETNALLHKKSRYVASRSLHMQGKAADIRIHGFNTRRLRNVCAKLKVGGVGYYPRSDFVHVDIGDVRHW